MPGKVNPSQCEALTMVALHAAGCDATVSAANAQGPLQLNVYKPVILHNVLEPARLLADACQAFTRYCVEGLEPDVARIDAHLQASLMLVTALAPHIGYDRAASIALTAHRERRGAPGGGGRVRCRRRGLRRVGAARAHGPTASSLTPGSRQQAAWPRSCTLADVPGLRYISDQGPGIRRVKRGRGFIYVRPDGRRVRDAATVRRIAALVIPPAWTEVWIAPHPQGHVQATGRDARGRKQHRYHPRWVAVRDAAKYSRTLRSARRCRRCAAGSATISPRRGCQGRRCSPWSCACSSGR